MTAAFIHKPLRRYLVAGIAFNGALLCLIGLHNYKSSLMELSEHLTRVPLNIIQMQDAVEEMDHVINSINGLYPHMQSRTHKDALLLAADTITRAAPGARLVLGDMSVDGSAATLPMDIAMTTTRYSDIVSLAGYLQSLTFPSAAIQELRIEKEGVSHTTCIIKVLLRMPQDHAQGDSVHENMVAP